MLCCLSVGNIVIFNLGFRGKSESKMKGKVEEKVKGIEKLRNIRHVQASANVHVHVPGIPELDSVLGIEK